MTEENRDNPESEVVEVLRGFCTRLNSRLDRFAEPVNDTIFPSGIGTPGMFHIFEEEIKLNKELIGQKPHRFIGRYLIEPSLKELGYEYIPEPRGGNVEKEDIYPDFRLMPVAEQSGPLIIGELKNPGGIEGGVNDLKQDYLMELPQGSLGIATDGINWKVYQRSANSVEKVRPHQVSLRKVLHDIRQPLIHDKMDEKDEEKLTSELERFVKVIGYPMNK